MAFKDYVDSLPNLREDKIKEIAEATCSHTSTVYRWMNGSITPPLLKQKVISSISGIPIEKLFPTKNNEIILKNLKSITYDPDPEKQCLESRK